MRAHIGHVMRTRKMRRVGTGISGVGVPAYVMMCVHSHEVCIRSISRIFDTHVMISFVDALGNIL